MKNVRLLAFLVLGLAALASAAPKMKSECAGDQEKPKRGDFEGSWLQLCFENQGKLFGQAGKSLDVKDYAYWKITADRIEKPTKDGKLPAGKWVYKIDPAAKPPTIDGAYLDKDGKEQQKLRWRGIYELNGDYLMICLNAGDPPMRPEKFTTTGKSADVFLFILRRTKKRVSSGRKKGAGVVNCRLKANPALQSRFG